MQPSPSQRYYSHGGHRHRHQPLPSERPGRVKLAPLGASGLGAQSAKHGWFSSREHAFDPVGGGPRLDLLREVAVDRLSDTHERVRKNSSWTPLQLAKLHTEDRKLVGAFDRMTRELGRSASAIPWCRAGNELHGFLDNVARPVSSRSTAVRSRAQMRADADDDEQVQSLQQRRAYASPSRLSSPSESSRSRQSSAGSTGSRRPGGVALGEGFAAGQQDGARASVPQRDSYIDLLLEEVKQRRGGPGKLALVKIAERKRAFVDTNEKLNSRLIDELGEQQGSRYIKARNLLRLARAEQAHGGGGADDLDQRVRAAQQEHRAKMRRARLRERHRKALAALHGEPIFRGVLELIVEMVADAAVSDTNEDEAGAMSPTKASNLAMSRLRTESIQLSVLERKVLSSVEQIVLGRHGLAPPPASLAVDSDAFFRWIGDVEKELAADMSEEATQRVLIYLRQMMSVPEDAFRSWLTQRSMLHFFRPAPGAPVWGQHAKAVGAEHSVIRSNMKRL